MIIIVYRTKLNITFFKSSITSYYIIILYYYNEYNASLSIEDSLSVCQMKLNYWSIGKWMKYIVNTTFSGIGTFQEVFRKHLTY